MSEETKTVKTTASNIEVSVNTIIKKEEVHPFKFE
jgi:hypothetical protein